MEACIDVNNEARAYDNFFCERFGLTRREVEVLTWVADGKSNTEIGQILGMSPRTVQKHLEHIFEKLGVETRTAAAVRVLTLTSSRELGSFPCSPPAGRHRGAIRKRELP